MLAKGQALYWGRADSSSSSRFWQKFERGRYEVSAGVGEAGDEVENHN